MDALQWMNHIKDHQPEQSFAILLMVKWQEILVANYRRTFIENR
jgi:hypothetical protein